MKKVKWFIICIAIITFLGFVDQGQKVVQMEAERKALLQEETQVTNEVETLKTEVSLLQDTSYVEILARENLGMIYPNETLFVKIQDDKSNGLPH